jgi:hypothetical protein
MWLRPATDLHRINNASYPNIERSFSIRDIFALGFGTNIVEGTEHDASEFFVHHGARL